ncbi:Glucitol operon repressor [Posidoniimonas polymericola]|uniref:Glucitol operon repressor n=1 Tax=Posidoniimonas polymericola TaxID=2528002 RepID=A0A5C5ZFH4_9BACT|nr:Glucitol operon repressor [Posidoniimonas polymericola]
MVTERRKRLLELVRRDGFASLPALAERLEVSESTVRRDLMHLERDGLTRRTHGGAFYAGPSPHLSHFRNRQTAEWSKKRAIAHAAEALVPDTGVLLLDGGTTTYELARRLTSRPLQVVTNSLPVANLFSSRPEVDLILIGGYLKSTSGVLVGAYAEEMLGSLRVQTAVISAAGINETGLYNTNHMIASTQQAMIRAADEVILVADSTKLGRQSIAKVCGLDQIDHLVVDSQIDKKWFEPLRGASINLVVADDLPADDGAAEDGGAAIDPTPNHH